MTQFHSALRIDLSILASLFATLTLGCGSDGEGGAGGAGLGLDGGFASAGKGGSGGNSTTPVDVGDAGRTDAPGGDGRTDGSAGAGGTAGATGATQRGIIQISQNPPGISGYGVSASFVRFSSATPGQAAGGGPCTASTIGPCLVSVCPTSNTDTGRTTVTSKFLDAGTITITGAGASQVMLTVGLVPNSSQQIYSGPMGTTPFFTGGDTLVVVGAGGADLPAFAAQSITAPSVFALVTPNCSGVSCPDVDRTQDLPLAWTGGVVGKVRATFETISDTGTSDVFCDFDAKDGAGTIPAAALALLGQAGDATTTGVEMFTSFNESSFLVGDTPTTFTASALVLESLMNVSN